ncbi:MAG: dihydrolipoyl dehydrogenase [Pseudomonadota bacterium]
MTKYDLIIIGAGVGGYTAAIKAAQEGLKTAIIEKDKFGGVCLNKGCIPVKRFFEVSKRILDMNKSETIGIKSSYEFDWQQILQSKDQIVKKLSTGVEFLLKGHMIDSYKDEAKIIDKNKIQVGEEILETDNLILACGSRPLAVLSNLPCQDKIINSDGVFNLEALPASILIVGGGVIGVEFANIFSALGVNTSLVELMPEILPGIDNEFVRLAKREYQKRGIKFHTSTKIDKLEKNENNITAICSNGQEIQCDLILEAVGRTPNMDIPLALELELDNNGRIKVDKKMLTSIPNVYAIGDITGSWLLAHVAAHEGIVAVENICKKESEMNYEHIPLSIFTVPEISWIGKTEDDFIKESRTIKIGKFLMAANGKALTMDKKEGMVKLIADEKDGIILAGGVIGADASSLIGEIGLACKNKLKATDIYKTIHSHPTLTETILEAAMDIDKKAIHKVYR